jgi:AraC-like DNA-binding protein
MTAMVGKRLCQIKVPRLDAYGFGAALGLFFGIALLRQRSVQNANDFLAAFCACFVLLMVGDVWVNALGLRGDHWSGNALDSVFLALPPLFYFYVATLVSGVRPTMLRLLLSLLPAALCGLWFAEQLALSDNMQVNAVHGRSEFMPTAYTLVFVILAVVQLSGYCVATFGLVRAHARGTEENYSSLQKVNLRWVQALIGGGSVAALFWVLGIVVQHPLWSAFNAALPPVMMLALGVLAQHQAPLHKQLETTPSGDPGAAPAGTLPGPPSTFTKYAKSGLTEERMQALADQLAQFMAQDKAFLEGDLTLGQLAGRMGVPQHHISQVLNQHLACSFFEYINRLRVQEAQRCLADPAFSGQTVLEVGMAAGFNSKAAFNTAFKRFTGTTPSDYRTRPH